MSQFLQRRAFADCVVRYHLREHPTDARVRLKIIRNARIENVVKSQSCMVSQLRIMCKQSRAGECGDGGLAALEPAEAIDAVGADACELQLDRRQALLAGHSRGLL